MLDINYYEKRIEDVYLEFAIDALDELNDLNLKYLSQDNTLNQRVNRFSKSKLNITSSNFIERYKIRIYKLLQENKDILNNIISLFVKSMDVVDIPMCFNDFKNIIIDDMEINNLIHKASIYYSYNYYCFLNDILLKENKKDKCFNEYLQRIYYYQILLGGKKVTESEMINVKYEKNTFLKSIKNGFVLYPILINEDSKITKEYLDKCIKFYEENSKNYERLNAIEEQLYLLKDNIEKLSISGIKTVEAQASENQIVTNKEPEAEASNDEKNINKELLGNLMDSWGMDD